MILGAQQQKVSCVAVTLGKHCGCLAEPLAWLVASSASCQDCAEEGSEAGTDSPNCFSPTVLEVHQFAQEAVVADAWLTAQEPLLKSREWGNSLDEVEQLIRRHEAFRKAAAAWEERFSSLRRLTTVCEPETEIWGWRRSLSRGGQLPLDL